MLFALTAAWIYAPAWAGDWLWDDGVSVLHNPLLRTWRGLAAIWVSPEGQDYFPLCDTVRWIQWHCFGARPEGYHLCNVALHVASALLFVRLLGRTGVAQPWIGGALFLVTPLAVESVAWITELKNTLSLPPLLLALLSWVDWQDSRKRGDWIGALAWFVAASLCKPSVLMLPLALLAEIAWKRGRLDRRECAATLPFFAWALAAGVVAMHFQAARAIAGAAMPTVGALGRTAAAGLALGFYALKTLLPFRLLPVYPAWTLDPPPWTGFLVWAAVLGGFLALRRASGLGPRSARFGAFFFGIFLLPVLGWIPMAYHRMAWVADQWAYIPLLGLLGLGAAAAGWALSRARSTGQSLLIWTVVGAILLFWAAQSRSYAAVFADEERLWRYTLARNDTAWIAHANLGSRLLDRAAWTEAEYHLDRAVALNPRNPNAENNLALLDRQTGRSAAAVAHFQRALELDPTSAAVRINLAQTYLDLHEGESALVECHRAAAQTPLAEPARAALLQTLVRLGNAFLAQDAAAPAAVAFRDALSLEPDRPETEAELGGALAAADDLAGAELHFRRALALRPTFPEAHNNLGSVLARQDKRGPALAEFQEALRERPGYSDASENLRTLLAEGAGPP